MVERQPANYPRAAVVTDESEALEADRAHQLELVFRHGPFGVRLVAFVGGWFGAVAVASEIGADDCELLGEPRRDSVPDRVRLRVPVQEEDGRAYPAANCVDRRVVDRQVERRESWEQSWRGGTQAHRPSGPPLP
jgi:hypothetical protein